ncbi:hypothetical protein OH77DRAFT_833261 [Trametes cingulata]|nr:hypothetical protein OH77DRAFT_833261 [Trametes cingulata]
MRGTRGQIESSVCGAVVSKTWTSSPGAGETARTGCLRGGQTRGRGGRRRGVIYGVVFREDNCDTWSPSSGGRIDRGRIWIGGRQALALGTRCACNVGPGPLHSPSTASASHPRRPSHFPALRQSRARQRRLSSCLSPSRVFISALPPERTPGLLLARASPPRQSIVNCAREGVWRTARRGRR